MSALRNAFGGVMLVAFVAGCGTSSQSGGTTAPKRAVPTASASENAKIANVQSLLNDYADTITASTEAMKKITDKDSAASAAKQLTKSAQRVSEIANRLKSVGKITEEENAHISAKAFTTADAAFDKAYEELSKKLKGGDLPPDAVQTVRASLVEYGKATKEISETMAAVFPK
jgi:hypothetical protein